MTLGLRQCGLWGRRLFCVRNTRLCASETAAKSPVAARRYTKEHEWVQPLLQQPGRVRIGITDYAQRALGDLVYVELPKVGMTVKKQDAVGVVESVKGASDVYAPVSGTVAAINELVVKKPSFINKSPEGEGWLCDLELSDSSELEELLDQKGYEGFCQGSV